MFDSRVRDREQTETRDHMPSGPERCWLVLERYTCFRKTRRVLVVMDGRQNVHTATIRVVNSQRGQISVARSDLEPLSELECESLEQLEKLGVVSEAELAKVCATLKEKGCTLEQINFKRSRGGELTGERKDALFEGVVSSVHFGCSKRVVRLGKRCTTPGCEFLDFHDGPCTHELVQEGGSRRTRRRVAS